MTLVTELATEIQKLAPSAMIELFVLDTTPIGGLDILRFHAGTNALRQNVVWQGETYSRFPIEATGFEFNGAGQFPRPKIKISNILSAITTYLLSNNDLLGSKLSRKRTLAKFLDAVNFDGGVNADEDPTAEIPDDIYYVDRKSHEDRDVVEFELATAVDVTGVQLPNRQIIQNICPWLYRGPECGYTGAPLFDVNDNPITSQSSDSGEANDVVEKHEQVRGSWTSYNNSISALSVAARNRDSACAIQLSSTQYHEPGAFLAPVAGDYVVFQDRQTGIRTAIWNGVIVTIGTIYRVGGLKNEGNALITLSGVGYVGNYYEIQYWAVDAGSCSLQTTAYNTAVSNRDSAKTNYDTAVSDADAADAALPPADTLYLRERCGKRLESCKLRFGENNPLPFGGFPASGLFK